MRPSEALRDVRGFARAGRVVYSGHAERRMRERGATRGDVRRALVTAAACEAEPDARWRVSGGRDLDGDELTVVVALEDGVVVVTVF